MPQAADRRRFLKSTATLAALAALRPRLSTASDAPRTAIAMSALPTERTIFERFRMASDAGFSGIEMWAAEDPSEAEQVRLAATQLGLSVHSVVNDPHRRCPLSSADPNVVEQAVAGFETSLRNARVWGADTVSITPTAAEPGTSYQDAWHRSQKVIRERILPLARNAAVTLAIEEVWEGFVVGPLEVARYVDAFHSRRVKASVDTSRGVFYARPEDWIRVLGTRVVKVRARTIEEAGVDSVEFRKALEDVAFDGWVTAETFLL
jgi:L-ribulose-5-phosphate 3-epimerase